MTNIHTTNVLVTNPTPQSTESENIFSQTLFLLEDLFNYRLVDRIARPRDKAAKQREINHFALKVQLLHEKMYKIKQQLKEATSSYSPNIKIKSILDTITTKDKLNWKKSVKLIQSKYIEILYQGSFKHCKKICSLLELEYLPALDLLIVQDWTDSCLQINSNRSCCC